MYLLITSSTCSPTATLDEPDLSVGIVLCIQTPTAGEHDFEPLDFIDFLLAHIPDKGQVLQRYYGYYSNRARGERRKAAEVEVPPAEPEDFSRRAGRRRWAELLRWVYEVDPLACPRCGGEMRIIAFIQQATVIDRIRSARSGHGPTHDTDTKNSPSSITNRVRLRGRCRRMPRALCFAA